MKYYPAFINIQDRKAVVVGGGSVAERKVRTLLASGARVKVISPKITVSLHNLVLKKSIIHVVRKYRKGDLKNAFIVVACTSSPDINKKVASEAEHLVNVVNVPSAGNYIVPSLVKRGQLVIAIASEGASPAVSKTIRREIEKLYGNEFARFLNFVEKVRKSAQDSITDRNQRVQFLKSLASEELFGDLRKKGFTLTSRKLLASLEDIKH